MRVTMVNAEWLPIPPVLGGAVEQTLYETATAVRDPVLSVISPWSRALNGEGGGPSAIFHHVHISEQALRVREALEGEMPSILDYRGAARCFYYLNGVTDLLKDLDPDVIQVHNRPVFVPYLLRQFPEKRMVLYMHNEPDYADPRLDEAAEGLHHLVFVSRFLADRFVSRFPGCASRVSVIHNGVDVDVWHPGLKQGPETEEIRERHGLRPGRTALFVGRTVVEKGIHHLLEAMEVVRRRLPGAKLMVVGSPFYGAVKAGPFLERLRQRAAQMGDAVVFTGYVDRDRTPYYYAAADVTAVPSTWGEPFGKVVIESMASGTPVVGSRRGAIPEIVDHGVDGLLVDDPKDAGALARSIVELMEDSERRREMGDAARRKVVRRFTRANRLRRLQAFYRAFEARFF